MSKLHVKKGDKVLVLIKDINKKEGESEVGRVLSTNPDKGTVTVENVNIRKKHKKAKTAKESGGIIREPGPIDASNVMVICPSCDKATRIAKKEADGKFVRVCKKCGAVLDVKAKRGAAKADKKGKAEKEEAAAEKPGKKPKAPKAETATAEKPAAAKAVKTEAAAEKPVKKVAPKADTATAEKPAATKTVKAETEAEKPVKKAAPKEKKAEEKTAE